MKILFANLFFSYTGPSITEKMRSLGHEVDEKKYYTPKDLYEDEQIDQMVKKDLSSKNYDVVFSVNIWPPLARVCHGMGIPYIAWSYDSPQHLPDDRDLSYDTNFLYIYDKIEAANYNKRGITRIFHLPLATDTDKWNKIAPFDYSCDVSLVGSLYESTLPSLMNGMDEYHKGFIKAIAAAQQKIYGYFLIDELLTDDLMDRLNQQFAAANKGKPFEPVSTAQMSYSISTYVTYFDRLALLRLLGVRLDTHLYSTAIDEKTKPLLKNITIHGSVEYNTDMPRVFKSSKVNLNPSLKIIRSGISQRCLDVMGCRGFLLSSYQPELADNFENGAEVIMYDSIEDAVEKAEYYALHDDIREKISNAGYEKVKSEFTYEKRLEAMLAI